MSKIDTNKRHGRTMQAFIDLIKPVDTGHKLIRFGNPHGDGGYLVPDDLDGITSCFSPGVEGMVEFEKDMAKRGIVCHLADGTLSSPPALHENMHFTHKNLGSEDCASPKKVFKLGRLKKMIQTRPPTMRLDTWINQSGCKGDLLLQIDIEGYEYEVLHSVSSETLRKFRIIVIELHKLRRLIDVYKFHKNNMIYRAIKKLTDDFHVVHVHPNNKSSDKIWNKYQLPVVLELTLLRKDRVNSYEPVKQLPHPQDVQNSSDRPDKTFNHLL